MAPIWPQKAKGGAPHGLAPRSESVTRAGFARSCTEFTKLADQSTKTVDCGQADNARSGASRRGGTSAPWLKNH
jgi:hypothetical protein